MKEYIKDANALTCKASISVHISKAAISSIIVANSIIVGVITNSISNSRVITTISIIIVAHFNVVYKSASTISNQNIIFNGFKATVPSIKEADMIVVDVITFFISYQV